MHILTVMFLSGLLGGVLGAVIGFVAGYCWYVRGGGDALAAFGVGSIIAQRGAVYGLIAGTVAGLLWSYL